MLVRISVTYSGVLFIPKAKYLSKGFMFTRLPFENTLSDLKVNTLLTKPPLKMMKKAFYLIIKSLFTLEMFKFDV